LESRKSRVEELRVCVVFSSIKFRIFLKGNLVWKVSPPTIRPYPQNPYISVFERDGKVFGYNWCGHDFEISLADGTVSLAENPGRPW
jgi:hypothetical protein